MATEGINRVQCASDASGMVSPEVDATTHGRVFVKLDQVTKIYGTANGPIHALDQVSFDIREHEFVSVVGPSGCGKSTLLLIISGLLPSTSGRVQIAGTARRLPYIDLGIVFQRDVLLDWRTVLQNVVLPCELRGLDRKRYELRARELLRFTGLAGFEDMRPYQLSAGMRQRVSVCRALIHDPPLLLMDEPFGALDALTREQMNVELLRIWEQSRKTVLFVTHSIPEAVFLSDRVLVMSPRPGRIVEVLRIHLPRPRRLEIHDSPEFARYNHRIREIFRFFGVLTED